MNDDYGNIAKGYEATKPREERRLLGKAQAYKPNPELERLASIRDQRPEEYDKVSPSMKAALGYYLSDKAAYQEAKEKGLI